MSDSEEEKFVHVDIGTPEKPFAEMYLYEDIGEIAEEKKSDLGESNDFHGVTIENDILEIDRQIDKVGAMICREEEAYAELEKKVNEIQGHQGDEREMDSPSVAIWHLTSKTESTSSEDKDEVEEGKRTTEDWISDLVPDLKAALGLSQEFTEERSTIPEENQITEAVVVAKSEVMLEADNPKLLKFQSVLKQHLLRQITKLQNSIGEVVGEYKKKETNLKADADLAYIEQQTIVRQRQVLENYKTTIESVSDQRKNLEDQIKYQKIKCDQMKEAYESTKSEMAHSHGQAQMLDDLVKKMSEHDRQQEREISLSKQKQSLNIKDKERLSKEKQAQDMLLWRMSKNVLEKRKETENRLRRTGSKTKECNILSERLLAASIDRAELLLINDLLAKELQKAFQCIKAKDSALLAIKKELKEAETNWKKLVISLNWYRKDLRSLMAENETLTQQKRKIGDEVEFLCDRMDMLKEERFRAMEELNSFDAMMMGADRDLQNAEQIGAALKADQEHIIKQISVASGEKMTLEKAYMEKLIFRDSTGKMVKHVNDLILKMVEEHKNKELKMLKLENQLAKEMVDLEMLKGLMRESAIELETTNNKINELENSKSKVENNIMKLKNKEFELKSSLTQKRNALEELEKSWTHKTYLDIPLVGKKKACVETIAKIETSIEEKELLWLEFQEGCLRAASKRQKQIERINFLRRQVVMMEGTLERSIKKLNEHKKELHQILGDLDNHRRKISALQVAEVNQGKIRQQAEENTREMEESFLNLLKDLEQEAMAIQQEVWELEEENEKKVQTTDMLQRELLEWNKKYSMAIDLKKEIEVEKQKGGEIAAMKQEIHRMEVRFSNLRKVEERLTNDLELCLSRRDSIMDSAEAKEKRAKANGISVRAQAWRRLEETRAKLRGLLRECKELKKEKANCLEQRKFLVSEVEFWKKSVNHLSQTLEELELQIKEGQIHRHMILEMMVMRQRKAKLLEELKCGRYRVIGKTEDNLTKQEESVFKIRDVLLSVIHELKKDFPMLGLQLKQIENTIVYCLNPE